MAVFFPAKPVLLLSSLVLVIGCSSAQPAAPATNTPSPTAEVCPKVASSTLRIATIGGGATPQAEVKVPKGQAEAVGALTLSQGGKRRVFCSGTLVTDRLVVTAAHCLLPSIYQAQGASPPKAASIAFVIGDDVESPRHAFDVAEVHLAPGADVLPVGTQYGPDVVVIDDFAALVLTESVVERFPDIAPIPWNDQPLDDSIVGAFTVTGAYGGTACAPTSPSGSRGWAASRVSAVDARYVRLGEIGAGQFAHGDSGGGALMAFPDGSVRLIGVLSSTMNPTCESTAFHRSDPHDMWLRELTRDRLKQTCDRDECGNVRCEPTVGGAAKAAPTPVAPPPPRGCGALSECMGACTELWCAHQCSLGTTKVAREKWSTAFRCQACSLGLEKSACNAPLKGSCIDSCKDGDEARCAPCFQAACKAELDLCSEDG